MPEASKIAMEAAIELEVKGCIGRVTTRAIGEAIQEAIDKAVYPFEFALHAKTSELYPDLQAEIVRLKKAVERMGIGVNHIATYRTDAWPDYGTSPLSALDKLGAGQEYDMWCCWNAAMCVRDDLDKNINSS